MLYTTFIKFLNLLIKALGSVLNVLFYLLPDSPFEKYIVKNAVLSKYLGYINYFVPVVEMLIVLEALCTGIAVYYIYQIVLRWIKAIE